MTPEEIQAARALVAEWAETEAEPIIRLARQLLDALEQAQRPPCETCQGRQRKTTDMVCMTCGRDYMPDDGTDETGPGLGWKRLMGLWREQCKQAELVAQDAERLVTDRDHHWRTRAERAERAVIIARAALNGADRG